MIRNVSTPFWKNLRFDLAGFGAMLFVFISLTFAWTYLSVNSNEFADFGGGFINGLGYLLILSLSICTFLGRKGFRLLGRITLLVLILFSVSTFLLGLAIGGLTNSKMIYVVVNSLFVSGIMVFSLDKFIGIEFWKTTMVMTVLLLLMAYSLVDRNAESLRINYGFSESALMFITFHVSLVVPLGIGLSLKKRQLMGEDPARF